eukprot:GHVU01044714.1.p1 GENE.GHVU01044714.1~~GHVU01044714.1.p1  ORF type:complete len:106 (+),score=3.85 GHVU01044714.1:130-447(+)
MLRLASSECACVRAYVRACVRARWFIHYASSSSASLREGTYCLSIPLAHMETHVTHTRSRSYSVYSATSSSRCSYFSLCSLVSLSFDTFFFYSSSSSAASRHHTS